MAGQAGQPVGVQPAADHQLVEGQPLAAGLHGDPRAVLADGPDRDAGADLGPGGGRVGGQPPGDLAEVDHRGVGRGKAAIPAHVRLQLAQLLAADHPDPGHPVGHGPLVDGLQPAQLALVEGDHHLAALVVGQAVAGAELPQQLHAPAAQPRLERPGHVVEAGVDDPAVAARLVPGQGRLLLEHGHGRVQPHAGDAVSQGDPDDAAPHDPDPECPHAGSLRPPFTESATANATVHYSQGADWMALGKLRLAPLSAPTPVGCAAAGGADEVVVNVVVVEQVLGRGGVGPVLLGPGDPIVVAGQAVAVDLDVEAGGHRDASDPVPPLARNPLR